MSEIETPEVREVYREYLRLEDEFDDPVDLETAMARRIYDMALNIEAMRSSLLHISIISAQHGIVDIFDHPLDSDRIQYEDIHKKLQLYLDEGKLISDQDMIVNYMEQSRTISENYAKKLIERMASFVEIDVKNQMEIQCPALKIDN